MRPWPTNVFGTIAASTTRDHFTRGSDGEVLGGLTHLLVRQLARDAVHARVVLARAGLEVLHLLVDVVRGRSGDVARLGMPEPRHQMARAARERHAVPLLHDRRRGLVLVGKPVGRVEEIVDLLRRVLLRAARHRFRLLEARPAAVPAWTETPMPALVAGTATAARLAFPAPAAAAAATHSAVEASATTAMTSTHARVVLMLSSAPQSIARVRLWALGSGARQVCASP